MSVKDHSYYGIKKYSKVQNDGENKLSKYSVKNLINLYDKISNVPLKTKLRTQSLNAMDSEVQCQNMYGILDQNIVSRFLTIDSSKNSKVKEKNKSGKDNATSEEKNKNSGKCRNILPSNKNKMINTSYNRSFSECLDKRKLSQDIKMQRIPTTKSDKSYVKSKIEKFNKDTTDKEQMENCEDDIVTYRKRSNSYVKATQPLSYNENITDDSYPIEKSSTRKMSYILATQSREESQANDTTLLESASTNSYVKKTKTKFEKNVEVLDMKRSNIQHYMKSNIDNIDEIFKKYRKEKNLIACKENREKLSLEINDSLLNNYKRLTQDNKTKTSALKDHEICSKTNEISSSDNQVDICSTDDLENNCITVVYHEEHEEKPQNTPNTTNYENLDYVIIINDDNNTINSSHNDYNKNKNPENTSKNEASIDEVEKSEINFRQSVMYLCDIELDNGVNNSEKKDKLQMHERNSTINEFSDTGNSSEIYDGILHSISDLSILLEKSINNEEEILSEESKLSYDEKQQVSDIVSYQNMGAVNNDNTTCKLPIQTEDNNIEIMSKNIDATITSHKDEDTPNITNERRFSHLNSSFSTNSDTSEILPPRLSRLYSNSFRSSLLINKETKNVSDDSRPSTFLHSKRSSFASNNTDTPEINTDVTKRFSRLYSGSFKRASLSKSDNEESKNNSTEKLNRSSSLRTPTKDDNNNTYKKSPERFVTTKTLFLDNEDKNDEIAEACNPLINLTSKEDYIKEWVNNQSEQLEENQKEAEIDITKVKKRSKVLHSCTVYDEQNNPTIRLSTYGTLNDINFDAEEENENRMIEESEKQMKMFITTIKNNSQKQCLMDELIDSEKYYVYKSLHRLVHDYMSDMDKENLPRHLLGKKRNIFGNVDILFESHKDKFYPCLKNCKTVEEIAECFLKHENIFKLYPLYTKNKPKSELIMKDYGAYFKDKQNKLDDRLDMSSYLLSPIQRMAKYCQIVKSLIKECEKEKQPCELLKTASDMLCKQMQLGNDLIAMDLIVNYDGNLKEQGDLLLRDTFIVQPPNRKMAYKGMIFLFQESILITSITAQEGNDRFEYRESFQLCDTGYTNNEDEPLVFKIWYRKRDQKMYTLRARNEELHQKWVKEIFNLLWKQLEANKRRKKKEIEETGFSNSKLPIERPITIPNKRKKSSASTKSTRSHSSFITRSIWYSS